MDRWRIANVCAHARVAPRRILRSQPLQLLAPGLRSGCSSSRRHHLRRWRFVALCSERERRSSAEVQADCARLCGQRSDAADGTQAQVEWDGGLLGAGAKSQTAEVQIATHRRVEDCYVTWRAAVEQQTAGEGVGGRQQLVTRRRHGRFDATVVRHPCCSDGFCARCLCLHAWRLPE